jgi:transposase-like protein
VWTGTTDPKGYGRWGKKIASRHSWETAKGPIPDSIWVLHHCDNPPCVNLDHLYLGTVVENVRDAIERGCMYRPPRRERCTEGHLKEGGNLAVVISHGRTVHRCRKCENKRSADRQRRARHARGLRKTRLSDDEKLRILALRRGGLSQRKIAQAVGRSLMPVQNVLREAGL